MFLAAEATRPGLLRTANCTGTTESVGRFLARREISLFVSFLLFPSTVIFFFSLVGFDFCVFATKIAGSYPGVTREDYFAVTSEEVAVQGQWTYDFSDPDGPQLGTVAIESSNVVACAEDPVVLIAEHTSIGVPLPEVIKEPVDIIVLCDRAATTFAERKFLVLDSPERGLTIGAFPSRTDLPSDCEIIGHVVFCQVPWLPSMKATKTGFLEADEYF